MSFSSALKKEVLATTCENDSDAQKKAEKTDCEKEKEFAIIADHKIYNDGASAPVVHSSIYSNNYQSAHFSNISIPPPDTFTI